MDAAGRLDDLRQSDLSAACVSSDLKRWGGYCDLGMIPHFPPTELTAVLRGTYFPARRTFRMCLARLAKACQIYDCDATPRFTGKVKAVAKGLRKSPAISEQQLRQLVRFLSLRY